LLAEHISGERAKLSPPDHLQIARTASQYEKDLFAALNSLKAAKSLRRKVNSMMSNGTNMSIGSLKQIDAGVLNVGCAEAGKSDGTAVMLLHGWPYDIHSFVDVAPRLAQAGYRVIVPYLRGYGTTRFLSNDTLRNGQQSVLAVDIIALMDALQMSSAILAGVDWGARSADIIAAIFPERCKALVPVSGYRIGSQQAGKVPLPPQAELQWWYQYYFATERGRRCGWTLRRWYTRDRRPAR
jgi:pimeloyl-ACP methyl ester carboxylesterase